jgi:hypothetical protein
MKKILLVILFAPFLSFSQSTTGDPALNPLKITTITNANINTFQLPLNGIFKLKVPILNKSTTNVLPDGTCKIKIGLGSKLELRSGFELSQINTSTYFSWTAETSGGQVQITGNLVSQLPANFSDTATFEVRAKTLGNSTITANFLVTNHNSGILLSDDNGSNNLASLAYGIVDPATVLPVTFTNIYTENKDCSLKVFFDIENEINVKAYELEVSKDLINFERITYLNATNSKNYSFNFDVSDKYQLPVLLVRVKSIDFDGKFNYSAIRKVSGICSNKVGLSAYPNPIPKNTSIIYIQKDNGFFNGVYVISIMDMAGKIIKTTEVKLLNVAKFDYNIENISGGQYLIRVIDPKSNTVEVIKILKQ